MRIQQAVHLEVEAEPDRRRLCAPPHAWLRPWVEWLSHRMNRTANRRRRPPSRCTWFVIPVSDGVVVVLTVTFSRPMAVLSERLLGTRTRDLQQGLLLLKMRMRAEFGARAAGRNGETKKGEPKLPRVQTGLGRVIPAPRESAH